MRVLIQSLIAITAGCVLAAAAALGTGCVARPAPTGASAQRQQLLFVLEREMKANTGWVRVHAADALLDHHHPQTVAQAFASEADTATPPYRIGVWRVLARAEASKAERQAFIEQIRRTMLDPQAPDRVHAAESLAKLRAAKSSDSPALAGWLAAASEPASVYPLWLLVLSGDNSAQTNAEDRLRDLLDSSDSTTRLRAAFALGRIRSISPGSVARLSRCLQSEPQDSPARAYLAAACLRHAPKDSAGAARLKRLLADCLVRGQPAEQLEAAIALGLCGTAEDLPMLARLLHSPEADARIGGASGSLYILEAGAGSGNR